MNAKSLSVALLFLAAHWLSATSEEESLRSEANHPVISHIPRDRLGSSAIASIGYSRRRHILEIEFVNGAVYRYLEVPPSVYRELMLMSADSKARYYDRNIKGSYRSLHVRPRPKPETD